jgi:hypothetical protein
MMVSRCAFVRFLVSGGPTAGVDVAEGDGEGVGLSDVGVADAVGVADRVGTGLAAAFFEGDGEGVGLLVGVFEGVGLGEGEGVGLFVGVLDGLGLG